MQPPDPKELRWLDIAGLVIAGIINSLIAPATAGLVLAAGMIGQGGDLAARSTSVAANPAQWQWGWSVWFFVTLSFAWSYYALARHLGGARQWRDLSVGVAVIAAAVDLVGILVYIVILPPLAQGIQSADVGTGALTYASFESLAYALTNVGAFGFYTIAGLLLLPATFATTRYPRWLAWLGVILWGISALATALLIFAPYIATPPLVISILLFGPWVWGSAWWIWRKRD
jgi:hypothetical protein